MTCSVSGRILESHLPTLCRKKLGPLAGTATSDGVHDIQLRFGRLEDGLAHARVGEGCQIHQLRPVFPLRGSESNNARRALDPRLYQDVAVIVRPFPQQPRDGRTGCRP
jgi:hypothetical protein